MWSNSASVQSSLSSAAYSQVADPISMANRDSGEYIIFSTEYIDLEGFYCYFLNTIRWIRSSISKCIYFSICISAPTVTGKISKSYVAACLKVSGSHANLYYTSINPR